MTELTTEKATALQDRIFKLRQRGTGNERIIIALGGIPGSGKSTIAAKLLERLHRSGVHDVAVVPMDGFHHSKATLSTFSDPEEAFLRRGAPFTYDAEAFIQATKQLRSSVPTVDQQATRDVLLPSFDHAIQDPVDNDIVIRSNIRIVILEGNYVLLDQSPWNRIATLAHDRWFVDVPRDIAKQRLVKRHLEAGIETTRIAAEARVEANDLRNADLILANLILPNVVIRSV